MRGLTVIGAFLIAVIVMVSCQNEQQMDFNRYYSAGATVYKTHCQNCHGDKGQGLAALIPPLSDSSFLTKYKSKLTCYVLGGAKGKILINGKEFDEKMPPVHLSNMETAQVLTYVTNSFGNKLGLINLDDVLRDLKGCN